MIKNSILKTGDKEKPPERTDDISATGYKLIFDLFKHLTTLSTGSLLLTIGFIDKLFPQHQWGSLIVVVFVAFFITVVASFISMLITSYAVSRNYESNTESKIYALAATIAILSFIIGIICLIVFFFKNSI